MALVESNAAFLQRCNEIHATGNFSNALAAQNIGTFSAMAFSLGTPQTPPTDQQFDNLAVAVFGAGFTLGQTSMLRRLHFEATTLMIASVKQRVDGEAAEKADSVKKIPIAEKRFRLEQQEQRLAGINISGELEPSHQLVDLANNILETGSLVWIAPSRCTKRSDEVQLAIRERPSAVQVENHQLKVAQTLDEFKADHGSEIKLQWCWQRRGLAMDQCRLLSWHIHDAWVHQLFRTMSQQPPPGFQQVKVDQLIRADRELWTLLAQDIKGSLKPDAAGAIPLDAAFPKLCQDPRITMFLLPSLASSKVADKEIPKKAPTAGPSQPAAKSAGGNKRRKTRAEKGCPEELKKFQLRCEHGPVCWAYNLKSGCKNSTSGKPSRCAKGFHVCANCHKPGHSVVVCRGLAKADGA
jgi:hypothetical protein